MMPESAADAKETRKGWEKGKNLVNEVVLELAQKIGTLEDNITLNPNNDLPKKQDFIVDIAKDPNKQGPIGTYPGVKEKGPETYH